MGQRFRQIGIVLAAGLLFPYMVVLLAAQKGIGVEKRQAGGAYQVILNGGMGMDAEAYLAGILARQISADYPEELLKAQALLARTWLYRMMGDGQQIYAAALGDYEWNTEDLIELCGENYMEDYKRLYAAAYETEGETIWYEGERITPLYHALSAGETRFDTSGACPYLIGRECSFDMEAPGYQQVQLMEPQSFWAYINGIDPLRQVGENTDIAAVQWEMDEAGYVLSATVGDISFSGQELQNALGVQSPWLRAERYGDRIRVISKGIGHGYGLSQWEGKRLAESGYGYREILEYFFHGITIKNE